MALLDRVPGELELYIGGCVLAAAPCSNSVRLPFETLIVGRLFTLRRREALQACGITHVLSVLRLPLDQTLFEGFQHHVVEVDDVDDENLLEHFEACNKFIQAGLDAGGGILVHCAMGKSRSVTCVCAYLIHRYGVTPSEALARIRESRSLAEPNDGFMKQLELYYEMRAPSEIEHVPAYQRWVYLQEVALSRACGQAPDAGKIRFEDEHAQNSSTAEFDLRCRKCRRTLANSQYIVNHRPREERDTTAQQAPTTSACAHYFLDPLSWMRAELEQGKLDGRLECPKCNINVGKYAWQGMQCSCGDWVVPGISLTKSRLDMVKSSGTGTAIRVPPSAISSKSGAGRGNL